MRRVSCGDRQLSKQQQRESFGKGALAHQFRHEIVPAHDDAVDLSAAQISDWFAFRFHNVPILAPTAPNDRERPEVRLGQEFVLWRPCMDPLGSYARI